MKTIETSKLLRQIYSQMESAVCNLKANLDAETIEEADRNWHDQSWDAEQYGSFMCCCDSIDTLFLLLRSLKIPKKMRDLKFEKTMQQWSSLA